MGRVLAIGDVHGCATALQTLDKELAFGLEDNVIFLGDYVDRGPDSKGVIDYLIGLRERTMSATLRGNHEVMMMNARTNGVDYMMAWLSAGGEATMTSYDAKNWSGIPEAHWQFLEGTERYHETHSHFFVHANANPGLPLVDQRDDDLYWKRFQGNERPHCSGKTMVCGHTSQHSGRPLNIGHAVCIDTWVYGSGWLTCLDVNSGEYWQANQRGEIREARLERL